MCSEEGPQGRPDREAVVHIAVGMREVDRGPLFFVCASCCRTQIVRTADEVNRVQKAYCTACGTTLCVACGLTLLPRRGMPGTSGVGRLAKPVCGRGRGGFGPLLHLVERMPGTTTMAMVCSECCTMALPVWGDQVVCPRHPEARGCEVCAYRFVELVQLPFPPDPPGRRWPADEVRRWARMVAEGQLEVRPSAKEAVKEATACGCAWTSSCFGTGRRTCWGCPTPVVQLSATMKGLELDPAAFEGMKCTCACGGNKPCHGCADCARPVDRGAL